MAEIKLETVAKTFGAFAAVKGVNFTVDHGSFFVILGPSGCGKTTTLRMIADATSHSCFSYLRSIRT